MKEVKAMNAMLNIEMGVEALKNDDVLNQFTEHEKEYLADKLETLIERLRDNERQVYRVDDYFKESLNAFDAMMSSMERKR